MEYWEKFRSGMILMSNGNPQLENGHIDIANELAEALAIF